MFQFRNDYKTLSRPEKVARIEEIHERAEAAYRAACEVDDDVAHIDIVGPILANAFHEMELTAGEIAEAIIIADPYYILSRPNMRQELRREEDRRLALEFDEEMRREFEQGPPIFRSPSYLKACEDVTDRAMRLAPHVIDEKRPGEYMCRPIGVTEFGLVEDIRERAWEWGIHDDDFVRALEGGAAAAKLSLEVLRFMFLTSSHEAFTGDE
jgi:hypothetical protein